MLIFKILQRGPFSLHYGHGSTFDKAGVFELLALCSNEAIETNDLLLFPLDFGTHIPGPAPKLEINVANSGAGRLEWEIRSAPPELTVSRHDQGFSAEIAPGFSGTLKGTLLLKSNGGDLEMPLAGTVAPPVPVATPPPLPSPLDPLVQALPGWWMNDAGALNIKLEGGALVYVDYNLLGVKFGQGTIQVRNGTALLQGFNSYSGSYTGQLTLQGPMLTGSLVAMGRVAPVMFMRQQPWFAAFAT